MSKTNALYMDQLSEANQTIDELVEVVKSASRNIREAVLLIKKMDGYEGELKTPQDLADAECIKALNKMNAILEKVQS